MSDAGSMSTPRTMLRVAGPSYFPIAMAARFPFAMMVVGVLTLVAAARDSIAFAGLASAVVGIGTAVTGPFIGAAADRFGQRRTLLACAAVNSASLLTLAVVAYSAAGNDVVLAAAFLIGASAPQVPPMSRSRLVGLIRDTVPEGQRARMTNGVMAYEAAVDETVFIFGPVVVGLLATLFSPAAPIVGAAVLTAVFVTMFAVHRSSAATAPSTSEREVAAPARELLAPGVLVLVAGALGVGLFFGTTLTSLTALMESLGYPGAAGLVYGIMGIGSTILALSVAAFSPRFTLRARWLTFAAIMLGAALLYAQSASVASAVVALAIAGLGIGPTIVTLYSLASERSPVGRSATTMTMLGSGVIVGQSLASAITGEVAEVVSLGVALWLPACAALLVTIAAVLNAVLRSAHPAAPTVTEPDTEPAVC